MHIACAGGYLEIAKYLREEGAGVVEGCRHDNIQPIHYACAQGHFELARWLYGQGVDLDARMTDGRQPIHQACYNGHLEIVQS